MAISVQGTPAAGSGLTIAIPTHQPGDVIIIHSFRDGNTTPPTVPGSGATVPVWSTIDSGGGNSCSSVTVYAVATASNHTSGSFTNSNAIGVIVLRGCHPTNPLGAHSRVNLSSATTMSTSSNTMNTTDGTSFILEIYSHMANVTAWASPASGHTRQAAKATGSVSGLIINSKDVTTSMPSTANTFTSSTGLGGQAQAIEFIEAPTTYPLTFPTVGITDDFNRADENPATRYPTSGTAGNTVAGRVKSNQLTGVTLPGLWGAYDAILGNLPDNQEAWGLPITIDSANGGHCWFDLNITGEGSAATVDCYEVELRKDTTPDNIVIWETLNGSATMRKTVTYPWTAGWLFGAARVGSTVYALVNKNAGAGWETVLSFTDSSPSTPGVSKIGLGGQADTTPTGGMWEYVALGPQGGRVPRASGLDSGFVLL